MDEEVFIYQLIFIFLIIAVKENVDCKVVFFFETFSILVLQLKNIVVRVTSI